MTEYNPRWEKWVRWFHEILFSLNFSWITTWYERVHGSGPVPWLPNARFSSTAYSLLERLSWRLHIQEPPTVLVQDVCSFCVAIVVFLVLRLLARFSLTSVFLRTFAGAFAIAGFPVYVLLFSWEFFYPLRIEPYWLWLFICEAMVALICGILYYMRKWPLPSLFSILLLLLHFGFWGLATRNYVSIPREIHIYGLWNLGIWVSTIFYYGFPVFGFLSSLAWGVYSRMPKDVKGGWPPSPASRL